MNEVTGRKKPDTVQAYRFFEETFWNEYNEWPYWLRERVNDGTIRRQFTTLTKHSVPIPRTTCHTFNCEDGGYFILDGSEFDASVRFWDKERFEHIYDVIE